MTPSQLLARIEAIGTIDAKYVDKIRKQIQDPEKVVKTKAIVKYLLTKNQIDKAQAKKLLAPPTVDEIEVVQPAPAEFDSSALIDAGEFQTEATSEPVVEVIAEPVVEVEAIAEPVVEVEPVVVVEAITEPIIELDVDATVMDQGQFGPDVNAVVDFGAMDPNGGLDAMPAAEVFGGDDAYADPAAQAGNGEEYSAIEAFKGKRDQRDQFKTKWLYIGFGILSLIAMGIAVLALVVFGQNADAKLKAANEAYDLTNWGDATKKIEDFVEQFPSHEEIPSMRAKRVHSVLRSKFESKAYEEMIKQADILLPPLAEEKDTKIDIIRDDLSVILPRGLDEIAQKAADKMVANSNNDIPTMEGELATIENYKEVIDNPVYIRNSQRKKQVLAEVLSRIENNIDLIKGLITKEKDYKGALVHIEELRTQDKTDEAFNDYRVLTRNHPGLASRKPLVELMLSISKKESELVQPIQVDLSPQNVWRPSVVSQSVVLSASSGSPIASLEGEVVPVVVDGGAYGFDAGNGAVVWRHFVGQQTTMPPVSLDSTHTLIVNQKDNDLICLNTQTGELVWRQEFGEAIKQPAIGPTGNFVVVSTESGKVIQLDAATGEVQKAAQLPQATGTAALVNTRDPIVYQVGKYSNLYVLDQQDYSCREVYSLGHYKDSVAVPPVQWAGYILVAINGGNSCDLHVFKPQKNGADLVRVQLIQRALDAPMTLPFIRVGNISLMAGENGQINMLSIDPTNDFAPISADSQLVGDSNGPRPLVSAVKSNVWVAANGIVQARIRRNQGKIERINTNQTGDQFLMATQKLDEYVFHVRRRKDSGMLTAALANAKDLETVWRTDFGGEIAGDLVMGDNGLTAFSGQGDAFSLDDAAMASGKATSSARASEVIQNLQFSDVIQFEDGLATVGPIGKQAIVKSIRGGKETRRDADMVFFNGTDLKLMKLAPPANFPACRPLKFGTDLIIASSSGYVALVNPRNNRMVGSPFQTAITPDSVINWLPPIDIGSDQVAIAVGESKGEPSKLLLLSAANKSRISKVAEVESEQPFKGELNLFGDTVLAVLGGSQVDLLATFSGDSLAKANTVELEGAVVAGPWIVGDDVLVKLDNDKLYMFGSDLTGKWVQDSPNVQFAGVPELVGDQLLLCYKSGKVDFVNPATGERTNGFDLQQPIVNRPLTVGNQMYFSGADGTVHVVDLSRLSN